MSIRQLADVILHSKPYTVDFGNDQHKAALQQSFAIMIKNLHEMGGVGIAANQCADIERPPRAVIVGTNVQQQASKRYPSQTIPDEIMMVNPEIIEVKEPYYPTTGEGCLSINGSFRAKIIRYKTVTVKYSDIEGNEHIQTYQGLAAHVILHEIDHLEGTVYFEKLIEDLSLEQKKLILDAINKLSERQSQHIDTTPILVVDRTGPENPGTHQQAPSIDEQKLEQALLATDSRAIAGMKVKLQQAIAASE